MTGQLGAGGLVAAAWLAPDCPGASRRGKPVKKPRFIPAQLAHQLARKLQARRLGTVAVL